LFAAQFCIALFAAHCLRRIVAAHCLRRSFASHRTALHCTALHCTALHCTALRAGAPGRAEAVRGQLDGPAGLQVPREGRVRRGTIPLRLRPSARPSMLACACFSSTHKHARVLTWLIRRCGARCRRSSLTFTSGPRPARRRSEICERAAAAFPRTAPALPHSAHSSAHSLRDSGYAHKANGHSAENDYRRMIIGQADPDH
jgi:hypothetical protein